MTCDGCGCVFRFADGDHSSAWSAPGILWDDLVVVAFCQWCGSDTCS